MVLRRVLYTNWKERTGGQRKGHCDKLHKVYFSDNTVKEVSQRGGRGGVVHVYVMEDRINAYRILGGNVEETMSFWKGRCRLHNNIKINLKRRRIYKRGFGARQGPALVVSRA